MGNVRDWGYREYPDDLTPGKGGKSHLLFDAHGNLTAHAPFHTVRSEDVPDDASDSTDGETLRLALVAAGAAAVVVAAVVGVGVAVRAKRRRRKQSREPHPLDDGLGATEASVDFAGEDRASQVDEHDSLIADVEALSDELESTLRSYRQRNTPRADGSAADPDPEQHEDRQVSPSSRGRRWPRDRRSS